MRRAIGVFGWLLAALYFGIVVALNVGIVREFYWSEGPWPGWWPLIESDALYGGLGLVVALIIRLAWRRLSLPRRPVLQSMV